MGAPVTLLAWARQCCHFWQACRATWLLWEPPLSLQRLPWLRSAGCPSSSSEICDAGGMAVQTIAEELHGEVCIAQRRRGPLWSPACLPKMMTIRLRSLTAARAVSADHPMSPILFQSILAGRQMRCLAGSAQPSVHSPFHRIQHLQQCVVTPHQHQPLQAPSCKRRRLQCQVAAREVAMPQADVPAAEALAGKAAAIPKRLAFFVSGGGSNFKAIHKQMVDGTFEAEIAVSHRGLPTHANVCQRHQAFSGCPDVCDAHHIVMYCTYRAPWQTPHNP